MSLIPFAQNPQANIADEKATLVASALNALKAANALDERDDLDAASWVAWYDATIPQVRDIKILAGAMEIELHRRRGEQILAEDEGRGGDQKSEQIKVHHRGTLIQAERHRRHRARSIAKHPKRVRAYVEQEAAAGRVPSVRGAMRAAQAAVQTSKPDRKTAQFQAAQDRVIERAGEWIRQLDAVADGERRMDAQIVRLTGSEIEVFLQRIRLIPWLWIDRTLEGTRFVIDQELRDICEGRQPRPPLGEPIKAFLARVRGEIVRRRKENHDQTMKSKWTHNSVNVHRQSQLLDWIEEELSKVTR